MKNQPVEYPEFAVTRKRLSSYFNPPLARSTFYDLVNRGKIQPVSGVRGYYRLNASLQRMGMPAVKELPPEVADPGKRTGAAKATASAEFQPTERNPNPLLAQMVLELLSYIITRFLDHAGHGRPQGPTVDLLRTSTLSRWSRCARSGQD